MAIPHQDPQHDPRQFEHYAKMGADGSVVAIVAVQAGIPAPIDGEGSVYVPITDLYPYDFKNVKAKASDVTDAKSANKQTKATAFIALTQSLKVGKVQINGG